jgi:hypothetical protein
MSELREAFLRHVRQSPDILFKITSESFADACARHFTADERAASFRSGLVVFGVPSAFALWRLMQRLSRELGAQAFTIVPLRGIAIKTGNKHRCLMHLEGES